MSDADGQQEPVTFIKNSRLLTGLFGYWPSFHDAEILSLSLSVGCAKPWIPGCDSPFLDMKVRLFDWNGTTADTLVEMQFRQLRKIELSGFSYQNSV
jgi:Immunity protein 50